jgi:hypothetical protein
MPLTAELRQIVRTPESARSSHHIRAWRREVSL